MTKNGKADTLKLVRCAVYTRKSTEEGLEQEFNSLDAQRSRGRVHRDPAAPRLGGVSISPDGYSALIAPGDHPLHAPHRTEPDLDSQIRAIKLIRLRQT